MSYNIPVRWWSEGGEWEERENTELIYVFFPPLCFLIPTYYIIDHVASECVCYNHRVISPLKTRIKYRSWYYVSACMFFFYRIFLALCYYCFRLTPGRVNIVFFDNDIYHRRADVTAAAAQSAFSCRRYKPVSR